MRSSAAGSRSRSPKGAVIKGHKIGLTSRAMQRQANITEPDYGALLDDMFYADGARNADEPVHPAAARMRTGVRDRPAVEGAELHDLRRAERGGLRVPAVEIVDGRTHRVDPETGGGRHVHDSIADNAGNAALVVGGRPIRPMEVDLRWVAVLCYRNGIIEESGVAAAVLNHPANGVAWLANKLAPFDIALEPGQFVLGGSFTAHGRGACRRHVPYRLRAARLDLLPLRLMGQSIR